LKWINQPILQCGEIGLPARLLRDFHRVKGIVARFARGLPAQDCLEKASPAMPSARMPTASCTNFRHSPVDGLHSAENTQLTNGDFPLTKKAGTGKNILVL